MNKLVWLTALACFSFSLLSGQQNPQSTTQQYIPPTGQYQAPQTMQEGTAQQYIPPAAPAQQAQYAPPAGAEQPTYQAPRYAQPAQPQQAYPQGNQPGAPPAPAANPTYPVQQYPGINQQPGLNQQYVPGAPNQPQPQPQPQPVVPVPTTQPPTRTQSVSKGKPNQPLAPPVSTSQKMLDQPLQPPLSGQIYYTEPGIVGYQNGRWIGSDHLYNLPKNIGVIVEIVRLPDAKTSLDESIIERNVLDIFRKANFSAYPLTGGPNPPFPYYHVLIITMPIPEGKIAYVSCRLFEQVILDRVQLAEGVYWQAITWEKQTLVQASKEEFADHIYKDVNQITNDFIERFKHFEELKNKFGQ